MSKSLRFEMFKQNRQLKNSLKKNSSRMLQLRMSHCAMALPSVCEKVLQVLIIGTAFYNRQNMAIFVIQALANIFTTVCTIRLYRSSADCPYGSGIIIWLHLKCRQWHSWRHQTDQFQHRLDVELNEIGNTKKNRQFLASCCEQRNMWDSRLSITITFDWFDHNSTDFNQNI